MWLKEYTKSPHPQYYTRLEECDIIPSSGGSVQAAVSAQVFCQELNAKKLRSFLRSLQVPLHLLFAFLTVQWASCFPSRFPA